VNSLTSGKGKISFAQKNDTFTKIFVVIYPSDFEQKLGFDLIRTMLRDTCLSGAGRTYIDEIRFSDDTDEITGQLTLTEELRQVILSGESFSSQDYFDMIPHIHRLRIAGTYLEPEQLSELKLSLSTILEIVSFFASPSGQKYPSLAALAGEVSVDDSILTRVGKIIDNRSNIRDDASPELKKIRKERASKVSSVEKRIAQNLKTASKSGWTPEDAGITIRNGRLVIPLLAKYKRQITGFIHDESATGQTVYIEPADIFETNNEIRELDYAERREIIRILVQFADFLRPHLEYLVDAYRFLGNIDFIRAKALFAVQINASIPAKIISSPHLHWIGAIHPLLYLTHTRQKKPVVPLTISLDSSSRILVISGPNAGGKSVCLKTVGLLQYMFQCGLLPPVKDQSEFGIFKNIFIDIGDEQSLENDLSTYTSKLLNISFFIRNLNPASLFLIDEFGTGTDPSLGGPIAEASLEEFNRKGSFGIVTTHYSNLKLLAGKVEGILNGAMLYDSRKLRPLYILETGKPGSSFAFEIARQIGFPEDVLEKASGKTGKTQLEFDKELQDIQVEKNELSKKAVELKVADDFLHDIVTKYETLVNELEKSKKEIIRKAKDEALQLINESNRLIEKTIREIRESQAEKDKTKAVRNDLAALKEKLAEKPAEKPAQKQKKISGDAENPGKDTPAMKIPVQNHPYQTYINELHQKLASFQMTLDLRGKRVDEAMSLLQRYIDDAILLTIPEVRILHGKGNGILRQVTREYLASVKEVRKYQDEHIERGGSGITVVTLR
jgi:DNA mismatch repair protein MutS2